MRALNLLTAFRVVRGGHFCTGQAGGASVASDGHRFPLLKAVELLTRMWPFSRDLAVLPSCCRALVIRTAHGQCLAKWRMRRRPVAWAAWIRSSALARGGGTAPASAAAPTRARRHRCGRRPSASVAAGVEVSLLRGVRRGHDGSPGCGAETPTTTRRPLPELLRQLTENWLNFAVPGAPV